MYQVLKNLRNVGYKTESTKNEVIRYTDLKSKEKKC